MPRLQDQVAHYNWAQAHQTSIQMRYSDLDTMGHLNNAVYVQYLETARLLMAQDFSPELPAEEAALGERTVIARLEVEYAREIKYGQQVKVLSLVERLGNTSWTLVSCITADGQPCAFGRVVQVAVDEQLRPRPVAGLFRERLSALLIQPSA